MGSIREEIAKNIAFYRKRKGLTQRELANSVGVKHNSVSTWESGANAPDVETIFKISDILGITVSDIYGQDTPSVNLSQENLEVIRAYQDLDSKAEKNMIRRSLGLSEVSDMPTPRKRDTATMEVAGESHEDVDERCKVYRAQLIEEKKHKDKSSVS